MSILNCLMWHDNMINMEYGHYHTFETQNTWIWVASEVQMDAL